MCFSATASFIAGGALSAAGILTVSKVKKSRELPLASIPLLFGVQQLIDGVVWLSFGTPILNTAAVYSYAFFTFIFWPIFTPLALLSVETNRSRRNILKALTLIGLAVGLFFLYFMLSSGVSAHIVNRCVDYNTPHPFRYEVLAFYVVVICGSFLVSSSKILNTFGAILLIAFVIAGWFYIETFTSVWCFFAAILSATIYWYFRNTRSRKEMD